MSYTDTSHCGTDHNEWLQAIEFYEKDLDILENRLSEIASKNTHHDAMAGVEHFQNQLIVQRNNIDELRHSINEHVQHVADDAMHHAGKMGTIFVGEHDKMKDEFESFEKVVKELRKEFNEYLTKWM